MRSLPVLLLFSSVTASTAQSWSPAGAAWAYHFYNGSQVDYRVEYWYSHDTLIDGLDVKVARTHAFGETGGPPIDNLWWEYTRLEDDVVFMGDTQGNWDTLYWFGEIGDRWWPIGSLMTCPSPHGMLEIVDTGHVMIGPLSLRNWSVVYIDSLGETLSNPFMFVERIGTAPRSPQVWDCSMIIEYFFCDLICYSDSELVSVGAEACEVAVDVPKVGSGSSALRVMPNPAQGVARMVSDHWEPGMWLVIYDGRGCVIERRAFTSAESLLDLLNMAPGPYQVVLEHPSGRKERSGLVVY